MASKPSSSELLTRAVEEVVPRPLAEEKLKNGKPMRLYLGIDPTGAKLHLGHSVPLRKLKAFADAGHHVIFLIGSFTAMIGDPTGRETMREPLTKEQVMQNFETYKKQAGTILDFNKIELRFNDEWLDKLSGLEFMNIGRHFTIQQMMQRDMFKTRISLKTHCPKCGEMVLVASTPDGQPILPNFHGDEWPHEVTCKNCKHVFKPKRSELIDAQPISPNEFIYPLMQAYDSVILDVDCEIGGNDQLFNMLCGRKLQKAYGKREKFVMTMKLLEGTDGRKMSKTYDNCIWLEDSAKDMFGKVMRIKDELITTYLECCTDIPMPEIADIEKEIKKGSNPKEFKVKLAYAIVTLYHGKEAADHEQQEFANVFSKKKMPEDIAEFKVSKGTMLLDALLDAKLVTSKGEARRLIEQGAVKLGDEVVKGIEAEAESGVYKVGKRKFVRILVD